MTALANLAEALRGTGRTPEAVRTAREGADLARAMFGDSSPHTTYGLYVLANAEAADGQRTAAEAHYREALRTHLAIWGPDHLYTAYVTHGLAQTLLDAGRPAEALPFARDAARVRAGLPDGDRLRSRSAALLARIERA